MSSMLVRLATAACSICGIALRPVAGVESSFDGNGVVHCGSSASSAWSMDRIGALHDLE